MSEEVHTFDARPQGLAHEIVSDNVRRLEK